MSDARYFCMLTRKNVLHTCSDDHIELHSVSHVDVLKEPEKDETHTWLEDGFGLCAMQFVL